MNRLGIPKEDLLKLIDQDATNIELVISHIMEDDVETVRFMQSISRRVRVSLGASCAMNISGVNLDGVNLDGVNLPFGVIRVGRLLYGINIGSSQIDRLFPNLKQVMQLHAPILALNPMEDGE